MGGAQPVSVRLILFDQICVFFWIVPCMCDVFVTDVYVSELVVVSNTTLDASTILDLLSSANFQVTDAAGALHAVTVKETTLVAGTTRGYWKIPPSRLLFIFILN